MVVPERRAEASDEEEDEFLSGEDRSGDDKSEFSVSEDEDGALTVRVAPARLQDGVPKPALSLDACRPPAS